MVLCSVSRSPASEAGALSPVSLFLVRCFLKKEFPKPSVCKCCKKKLLGSNPLRLLARDDFKDKNLF
jgi:hypothetical protein